MAFREGGRDGKAASRNEETYIVEIDLSGDLEAQIKQAAAELVPVGRGQRRTIGSALRRFAMRAQRQAQREVDEADEAERVLQVRIQKAPVPQASYSEIIKAQAAGQKPAQNAQAAPVFSTPAEYAAYCRRAAEPVLVPGVKLSLHGLAAAGVFIVELSVLHAVLDVKFPPILGAPEQALGSGPVIAVFLIAVVAGYFALRDCSERFENMMRGLARVALIPFLIGFGLFAAGGISEGLRSGNAVQFSMLASAASAGGLVESIVSAIGNLGMAAALSVVSLLSFVGLHGCLTSIRKHGTTVLESLGWRKLARSVEQEAKRVSTAKAHAAEKLLEAQAMVADAPRDAANWIARIVEPILAAAESLLIQKRISPANTPGVIPDLLSEQVAQMNEKVLAERIALTRESADPDLIEAELRKLFKTRKKGS